MKEFKNLELELKEEFNAEEFNKWVDSLEYLPIYPKGLDNLEDTGRYPQ